MKPPKVHHVPVYDKDGSLYGFRATCTKRLGDGSYVHVTPEEDTEIIEQMLLEMESEKEGSIKL